MTRSPEGSRNRRLPRARKSLGQHFLVSQRAATAIAEAVGDVAGRDVVEIGPGRGILTAALLRRGARVIGIELDERLADYLEERFAGHAGLEVIRADALETSLADLAKARGLRLPLPVAGNVPYAITSPLLRKLLAEPGELECAVLMLQREVAERLLASPGSRQYGSLTIGVRAVAGVTRVLTLSPAKFRPQPRVWSTVVRLDPLPGAPSAEIRRELERLTKRLFSGRRKQLQKLLRGQDLVPVEQLEALEQTLGLSLKSRPEELSVEGFLRLLESVRTESAVSP